MLALALTPVVIDMTILHVAVPILTADLRASGTETLWIVDIYPLVMAGLLVPMGTLSDKIGHRAILLTGIVAFTLASILAAFSPSALALIVARSSMAVGGSMVIPAGLAIIRQTFSDPKQRAMALGLLGSVMSGGAAIGPLIGGVLLERYWWGSVFMINLPMMALVLPMICFWIPKSIDRRDVKWSVGHAIILISGLISTVFALKSFLAGKGNHASVIMGAVFGIGLLWIFVRLQKRSKNPMLDLSLFSIRPISTGIIMGLVVSAALTGFQLTTAQELQYVLGKSPFEAGRFLLPLMVAAALGGPFAGWLVGHFGLRRVASLSLFASAGSFLGIAFSGFQSAGLVLQSSFLVLGLSLSIGLTASSIAIMDAVDDERAGAAGALEATSFELGSGLGIALFGGILSGLYRHIINVPENLPANVAVTAKSSIGETFASAAQLPTGMAETLRSAGQAAFSSSHTILQFFAAFLIGALSFAVWYLLKKHTQSGVGTRHGTH